MRRSAGGDAERVFGAVADGQPGDVLPPGRDLTVIPNGGDSVVVDVEEVGGDGEAPAVALAPVGIDADLHPMTTGMVRGPRTWPPAQVTAAASASRKSGMAASHSSR